MNRQQIKEVLLSGQQHFVLGIIARIEEGNQTEEKILSDIKKSVLEDVELIKNIFKYHNTFLEVLEELAKESAESEEEFQNITKLSGILSICKNYNYDWEQIKEFIDRIKDQEKEQEYKLFQKVIENKEEMQKTIEQYFDFSTVFD